MNKIFKCKCGNEIPSDFVKHLRKAQIVTGPKPNEQPTVDIHIEAEKDVHRKSETIRYQVLCGHCGALLHDAMLKQSYTKDSFFDILNAFKIAMTT